MAVCLGNNAEKYLAGGRFSPYNVQRTAVERASKWCPLSAKAPCETPFAMGHSVQDARQHALSTGVMGGLTASIGNGTHRMGPAPIKNNRKEQGRVVTGKGGKHEG